MGIASSTSGLNGVVQRAESRAGKINVTGRYHRLPKRRSDDYECCQTVLGSGYNGQVFLARNVHNKEKYAVKGFKLHGVGKEKKEELETEAEIFLGMDHPHVARLVDVYESEETLDLVMECMTGGELFKRVSEKKRFSERDAADATWQMLLAVNYIHSHGVVHRDIKLENFLYDKEGGSYLKLIDFGFSKIWSPNTKMALSCGTLAYVAPEVLNNAYTAQCDLWSLGVTVFILLFGYMPFAGNEERMVASIQNGRYTQKKEAWGKVSEKAQDFVKKLLVVSPDQRLTAADALKHPWVAGRDKDLKADDVSRDTAEGLVAFGQSSAFRRACMLMMAWSLTNEERAQVREAFMEIDTGRTGTITLPEFKKVVEQQFHMPNDDAVRAFHALDMHHTDEVHYSEFLAAMVSSRIQLHDSLLKATFARFDTDKSGFITVENLKQCLGETFDGEEVEKLLAEADASHDGKISYDEWLAYLKQPTAQDNHVDVAARMLDTQTQPEDKKMKPKAAIAPAQNNTTSKQETKKTADKCCCVVQ